ncbi:hypothetical protein RN001_003246 [Aquatica leii]|uniref:Pericentriolar material 1 protein C-terminal domain-containing protein n=1 Tax=Aquatica leii TaxID=1421715 RepID=A0AAN7PEQ0_9COLE|nr:hypothetical protein RN001_003246 [Aquatica leii]
MPDDRKKMYSKQSTGTVPKTKHRNNRAFVNHDNFQRSLSNNLGLDWQRQDCSNYSRNTERNLYHLPYTMDSTFTDQRQNPSSQLNLSVNGTLSTSSTSGSNSRRDSVGTIPKCDNVKKCPDKKQIEDKLNQIREYLRVTTSLMSSIKNDDQENHNMDVAVSEHMQKFSQLLDILACQQDKLKNIYNTNNGPLENGLDSVSESSAAGYQRNELEEKVELTNRKVQLLREQQNALLNLKRKAENQLRDARQAQENLLLVQQQQQQQQKSENLSRKSDLEVDQTTHDFCNEKNQFDVAIKELEDRLDSMRNDSRRGVVNTQENNRLDLLHDQLNTNNQLLQLLENRDTHLNSEQMELQQKLNELQGKKMQIDQLAEQLQNLGDDDDEDIGTQVRKIVSMKQQLSSLKDLLEVVKHTEFALLDSQNVNEMESESQDAAHSTKTDNIHQNVRINRNHNEGARLENNPTRVNRQWSTEKQSNKSLTSIKEREKVLAELKAKKRELEEIMYKQKDSTSINNDVCSETSVNKSDVGTSNVFDNVVMSWLPVHPYQHNQVTSAYSSDECAEEDANEYSELNSSADLTIGAVPPPQPVLTTNYTSFVKRPDSNQSFDGTRPREFLRQSTSRLSERCIPTVSTVTPTVDQDQSLPTYSGESDLSKAQLQKQLELIQCVCQSLLDQQGSNTSNVHHLRNNLTPSPMYAEPRSYASGNLRHNSTLNTNAPMDMTCFNNPHPMNCFALGEVANNQNMLAANTLQTQAFLLNTLNQCCQMLWFQQREIASLRSMICSMQEQMMNGQSEQDINSVQMPPNSFTFPARPASSLSNFRVPSQPRTTNPKANHVSAACSLPNLNPSTLPVNADHAYLNQNNIRSSPTARLLETSLNNTSMHSQLNLSADSPANNTALPSVNVNTGIVQPLPSQIWNGQALNNQVAPGNRANNYWDNFRSYSRQNLLSTSSKSNEGLQSTVSMGTVLERSNPSAHPYSIHPFTPPKLNMVHNESINTSEESTPRRTLNLGSSNKIIPTIPPDVLNINHNSNHKRNEQHHTTANIPFDINFPENNLQMDRNGSTNDVRNCKDQVLSNTRNRNEWHDNDQCDSLPKSKLFEELRENVYKEVANLISANENRPHFLIQLFRDLQHINSDSLRGRALQSIQTVLTNSLSILENSRGANRQSAVQTGHIEQENSQSNFEDFSIQQSVWSQSPLTISRNSSNIELENNEDPDIHNILKTVFAFLKTHNDEILQSELTDLLKDLVIKSMPFTQMFANTNLQERTFHRHFVSILNEALEKFQGRRISEIKKDLLKTISDILINEFSFIYLVQENIPDNCENLLPQCSGQTINENQLSLNLQPQSMIQIAEEGNTPQMQNEDLAEADQSCIDVLDEEGAVGGILNVISEGPSTNSDLSDANVVENSATDYPANAEAEEFVEHGLDQVPTRLTTGSRPISVTSTRDRPNASRSDQADHF